MWWRVGGVISHRYLGCFVYSIFFFKHISLTVGLHTALGDVLKNESFSECHNPKRCENILAKKYEFKT